MTNPETKYRTPRLHSKHRGTASIEALVLLPILVLLFISAIFVRDLFQEKQEALAKARDCAWQYSYHGCRQVPPGCKDLVRKSDESLTRAPQFTDALERGGKDALDAGDTDGFVAEILSELLAPVVHAAFDKPLISTVDRKLTRPAILGGGETQVTGTYRLACNVEKKTGKSIAMRSWGISNGN